MLTYRLGALEGALEVMVTAPGLAVLVGLVGEAFVDVLEEIPVLVGLEEIPVLEEIVD